MNDNEVPFEDSIVQINIKLKLKLKALVESYVRMERTNVSALIRQLLIQHINSSLTVREREILLASTEHSMKLYKLQYENGKASFDNDNEAEALDKLFTA